MKLEIEKNFFVELWIKIFLRENNLKLNIERPNLCLIELKLTILIFFSFEIQYFDFLIENEYVSFMIIHIYFHLNITQSKTTQRKFPVSK